ncbi:MAG: TIGR01620 family protein [Magnetococcales bacterium]|nr:TIGR01620 family protein [Magnetococcales bacterium]
MDGARTWIPPVELAVTASPKVGRSAAAAPRPVVLSLEQDGEAASRVEPVEAVMAAGESAESASATATGRGGVLTGLLLVAILLWVSLTVQDAVLFLRQQWQSHLLLGLFFTLLTLVLSGLLLTLVGREWRRFRRLRTLTVLRQESYRVISQQTFGLGQPLLRRVALLYQEREEMVACLESFYQQSDDYLGDRELLLLFSDQVLSVVDARAYQVVVRHASAAAVMTAISPMAWLDALFFLWRNLWMVREIAEVYGARPGAAGSLVLLRQAIRGMMGAGLTDLLATGVAHSMGDSVAALLMAKTGQGLSNGLFIARIGLQTMQACRPLPFMGEAPGLAQIRKALQRELGNGKSQER